MHLHVGTLTAHTHIHDDALMKAVEFVCQKQVKGREVRGAIVSCSDGDVMPMTSVLFPSLAFF